METKFLQNPIVQAEDSGMGASGFGCGVQFYVTKQVKDLLELLGFRRLCVRFRV